MKSKFFLVILSLLVFCTAFAQDPNIHAVIEEEGSISPDQTVLFDQAKSEKASVVALLAYVTADYGSGYYVRGCIDLRKAGDDIDYKVKYLALKSTQVRFIYIWLGPETETYTSSWYSVKKNYYYTNYVYWTGKSWKKGLYRLIIAIEQNGSSGAQNLAVSTYDLY